LPRTHGAVWIIRFDFVQEPSVMSVFPSSGFFMVIQLAGDFPGDQLSFGSKVRKGWA